MWCECSARWLTSTGGANVNSVGGDDGVHIPVTGQGTWEV
jgi:hypothetical protein